MGGSVESVDSFCHELWPSRLRRSAAQWQAAGEKYGLSTEAQKNTEPTEPEAPEILIPKKPGLRIPGASGSVFSVLCSVLQWIALWGGGGIALLDFRRVVD